MPVTDYTTTGLVASLKRRVTMPTNQSLFTESDMIAFMSDAQFEILLPAIHSVREEYFVISSDTQLVANQATYRIPSRASGGALRDVVLVDSNGNEISLSRIEPEDLRSENALNFRTVSGAVLENDLVRIVPTPTDASLSIRFKYERRPNDLISVSQSGKITAINGSIVTLNRVPSDWTTSLIYDIIRPDGMFTSVGDDLAITLIDGFDITFSSLPSDAAVGQYVALAGQSPIPQFPYEAHKILAQLGAARTIEANDGSSQKAYATAVDMLEYFKILISPRQQGSVKKIKNRKGIMSYSGITGSTRRLF